ncbi:MAG TPA: toll/interleukin-1 receptor domain-containing protein, partial [Thermoanaerobaculia bacterium]|nr:toll/interleukin-1 receptor domain-containing protein [Thermoanaerobaculia bacterium]
MSAIFLSHSSRDASVAAEVRERLREQGHRSVFLDFDPECGIPAGRDWEQELYRQLRACQAVIVLCSEHTMASHWCFAEITHAKALGKQVFPVKVAPCEIEPILTSRQILDLTRDPEDAYRRLWAGLKAAGLDPADAFDWDGSRPPYPGLLAFQEEDAAVFFGREREIHEGLQQLRRLQRFGAARMLLVLGASGSGKSSLVRAGLLPRLRRSAEGWIALDPFRPGDDPFRELAGALSHTLREAGKPCTWHQLYERLRPAGDGAVGPAPAAAE